MNLIPRKIIGIALFSALLFLSGCGGTGPKFVDINPPKDSAVIHVYRVGSMLGGANAWYMSVNGKRVTVISNGGYYTHYAKPGNVTFSVKLQAGLGSFIAASLMPEQELITVRAKAGNVYYVRFKIGTSMELVSKYVGESEIRSLNQFEPL